MLRFVWLAPLVCLLFANIARAQTPAIAPEGLTAANHQNWFLRFCEDQLPKYAPTAEALQALFRKSGREVPQLVTADDLLANRRNLLQAMTRHVPRERSGRGGP